AGLHRESGHGLTPAPELLPRIWKSPTQKGAKQNLTEENRCRRFFGCGIYPWCRSRGPEGVHLGKNYTLTRAAPGESRPSLVATGPVAPGPSTPATRNRWQRPDSSRPERWCAIPKPPPRTLRSSDAPALTWSGAKSIPCPRPGRDRPPSQRLLFGPVYPHESSPGLRGASS